MSFLSQEGPPIARDVGRYSLGFKAAGHLGGGFAERLAVETDQTVQNYALIIYDDIIKHGAMTEIGAHGKGLSWKWLGVLQEGSDWAVVGYGNFQNFPAPYNRLGAQNKLPQIEVGSNMSGELFIGAKVFNTLPRETRQRILRALQLAINPTRIRIVRENEMSALMRNGTLPDIRGSISMSSSESGAGVSMVSFAAGAASQSSSVPFQVNPGYPIIIGRQSTQVPPYLDPGYQTTSLGPNGQRVTGRNRTADNLVSRAHFMLEADLEGRGIWIVNGVPGINGQLRVPKHGTRVTLPTQTQRSMLAGERILIRSGTSAVVRLPNGVTLTIAAGSS